MRTASQKPAINRRALLKGAVCSGLGAPALLLNAANPARAQFKSFPFSLGVASGEPAPDGFVIWTRLAPEPLLARGGVNMLRVEVAWDIAADPEMKRLVRSGTAIARIELAHAVHVEIDGLEPARDYFYRFRAGGTESPIGRARTLPPVGADVAQLKFASAGCQSWEGGLYTAWRRLAEESFDFVFHYGDYIYENRFFDRPKNPLTRTLPKDFPVCFSLLDYRRRYGLYKSDPDLQAAHASCAFLPSFDDHEVADNWAADSDPTNTPAEAFLFRRAAAFQAWYEHMPVRRSAIPRGPDMRVHRRFPFGRLAAINVLDTRQYRSRQACGDGLKSDCKEADETTRTMLGDNQERWLADGLRAGSETWQVLAQQSLFSRFDWRSFPSAPNTDTAIRRMDGWDGASAARGRLLSSLRAAKAANPVVLTGDVHMEMALEVMDDWNEPKSRCVGVELVTTSISSGGDGSPRLTNADTVSTNNPHLKFIGNLRGYTRHVVTAKHWQADFRTVERVSEPGAPVATHKSFVVEAGRPGLNDA
jgi:alkaline phosphatase D